MKRLIISIASMFALSSVATMAQENFYVYKKNGDVISYIIEEVDSISFTPKAEDPVVDPQPVVKTVFLAGDNVDFDGPLSIKSDEKVGPWKDGTLWYPTEMSNDPNVVHGVVIFCAGGGESSTSQPAIPKRLASHGFVVYSMSSDGTGDDSKKVFDWFEQMNNDPAARFYGKLQMDKVGITGHSMGGIRAEECANIDSRVCCLMMCNSGAFNHAGATNLTIPVGFQTGTDDMAKPNSEGDYNNVNNKAPMWLGVKDGAGHGYGPWEGANVVAAWMRWFVAGEEKWADEFLKWGGKFNNNNGWATSTKNW